jgi:hypothetical protein
VVVCFYANYRPVLGLRQLIYSTYGHVNSPHKRDAAAKVQFDAGAATSELAPLPDLSKMSEADLLALLQKVIPPT